MLLCPYRTIAKSNLILCINYYDNITETTAPTSPRHVGHLSKLLSAQSLHTHKCRQGKSTALRLWSLHTTHIDELSAGVTSSLLSISSWTSWRDRLSLNSSVLSSSMLKSRSGVVLRGVPMSPVKSLLLSIHQHLSSAWETLANSSSSSSCASLQEL